MTKGKGELNKKRMSMMFLICVLFLYVCLPAGVRAAELGTQAEAEISGGDSQLPGSEILSDGTSNDPEDEIFSSSDSALEAAEFTDEPEEAVEQNDEILLTDNTEAVWVNNVELITDADHEVDCGAGTASYDVDSGILTLSHATINQHNDKDNAGDDYPYIWLNTQKDCTIVLEGENCIGKADDSSKVDIDPSKVGIKSQGNLEIKGDGSLTIKAAGNNTFWGIQGKDISVHKSTLNCKLPNTVTQGGLFNVTGDITLEQAVVEAAFDPDSDTVVCIQCTGNISIKDHCDISSSAPFITDNDLEIEDSKVKSETQAESAFAAKGKLVITGDSDIIAHGYKYGLRSKGDMSISGGRLQAESTGGDAIYTDGNVEISSGILNAVSTGRCAIYTKGNVEISGGKLQAECTNGDAIYTKGNMEISGDANVTSKGYSHSIMTFGDMSISGGILEAKSTGGDAIFAGENVEISGDSDITIEANKYGIFTTEISISDGTIDVFSSDFPALYARGLEICGNPNVKAQGSYGLYSDGGDITISGGEIDAIGSNDTGILLQGQGSELSITGGKIHAKGKPGCAGIAAKSVQTATENAVLQLQADSMIEKNNSKIVFSDWSYDDNSGKNISWSSFIDETDDELNVESGEMKNAVNEVWLASPYTVTFDVNGGTGTTTAAKVYPGNKVVYPNIAPTRPGYYLSGWAAEDGSFFDINSTSVDRNMALKASWSPIVYDSYYSIQASAGEHGTITPSGTISVREYTDQTFTFTPEEGYETAEVLVDGKKVEATDSYKFERVTSGHTISVSFLKKVPETYPDGTVAKPDGSFETPDGVVVLPDGTVILNDKDKTELKPDSQGNTAIVNKNGTVTVQDGSIRNPDGTYARPAKPIIEKVDVLRNNAETILANETNGAKGYDYVISDNKNCIVDKDYLQVNKNILLTATTFRYVQKGTYYAYCHSWLRNSDGKKVFSQWSEPYEFTMTNYTPDTPSVVTVDNPKKGVVVVTVSVPKGAKGFDVILGREVKKVNGEKRPVSYGKDVIRNRKSTLKTVTFTNVKPGKVYAALHSYSRAQDTNMKVFSKWSAYKTLKVK